MKHAASVVVIGAVALLPFVSAAGSDGVEALRARARDLVGRMTLDEKISQLVNTSAAVPRLGVKKYDWWSEALHGVARNGRATVFPEPIGMAASFDPELIREVAEAIGEEGRVKYEAAQAVGRQDNCSGLTFWSPNVNIFRDPRWGRGMETWGEDPYLTSVMGVAFVKGLQGEDPVYLRAAACAKHYAVHSGPESLRHTFDAVPSKKDLYETYLPAFRALVREGRVESVMGAYNRVYGESASASEFLLKDVLRGQFGFKGHVVSDCGAINDIYCGHKLEKTPEAAAARALKNGLDLECGSVFKSLAKAVEKKLIKESVIDEALVRMFTTRYKLGIMEKDAKCPYRADPAKLCCAAHTALARRIAQESMVLLKNDGVLPIDCTKIKSFSVMGAGALDAFNLLGNYYGFSSNLVTYLEGLVGGVGDGTCVHFWPGYYYGMPAEKAPGVWANDDISIAVIGNTGLDEGEESDAMASTAPAGDRKTLALPPGQMQFLRNLHRASLNNPKRPKLLTVVTGGSPVEMGEILKLSDAVVMVWYAGQEGGNALADLILGKADFTGRLPMTFPVSEKVLPPFEDYSMKGRTYRYQTEGIEFPFGFGLSYGKAEYLALNVSEDCTTAVVTLENKSDREVFELVQIYVSTPRSGKGAPNMSLRGFSRVKIPPRTKMDVNVQLDKDAFTEIAEDGSTVPVTGQCAVTAASAAPSPRSAALGVRSVTTVCRVKPILYFFRSKSCKACVRIEALFSTQNWEDFTKGRIKLQIVDMDDAKGAALAKSYDVARKGSFVLVPVAGARAAVRLDACRKADSVIPWLQRSLSK